MKKILLISLAILICLIGFFIWKKHNSQLAQEKKIEKLTAPVIEKLEKQIEEVAKVEDATTTTGEGNNDHAHSIEQTMRVINGLELALASPNYRQFVQSLAREDLRGVPVDVLESRKEMLRTLNKLHNRQTELKEQENAWLLTQNISQITLNAISALASSPVPLGPEKITETSAEGIQNGFSEIQERDEIRSKIKNDIRAIEDELREVLVDYSEVYYKYLDKWDKILVHRDKAYLAVNSGNFPTARKAIADVLEKNPDDKEAQLLDALVDIESAGFLGETGDPVDHDPLENLENYINDYPGESAPALLLKGVHLSRNGDFENARTAFEQAAVNYPRQSEALIDRLNPYRVRSVWLKKSREGNYILDLYKATMLGAGYFSPDLQLARMYFEKDEFDKGKEKVLDHFSRRRNQAQWDNILADIDFCNNLLEKDFNRIFPEDSFLDLSAEVTTFGDNVAVTINNQSDVELSNVSLILCVHFTDMHRDDYATFKMEETLPALEPNAKNSFGKLAIDYELFGNEKTSKDIVNSRAVLISNSAVTWVDTDDFRLERIKAELESEQSGFTTSKNEYLSALGLDAQKIKESILEVVSVSIDENLVGSDKVEFKIPRAVALLKPVFRLAVEGGEEVVPLENLIKGDNVDLVFKRGDLKSGDQFKLKLYSRYMNAVVVFEGTDVTGFTIKDAELDLPE